MKTYVHTKTYIHGHTNVISGSADNHQEPETIQMSFSVGADKQTPTAHSTIHQ